MNERLKAEIERLKHDYPQLEVRQLEDGSAQVRISRVVLPEWWDPQETRVLLMIASDYPQNRPGWYVSPEIRLRSNGQPPANSSQNNIDGETWMSICWQALWNPDRENLWRLVKLIQRRFDLHE